jgi:hypothetical protein
MFQTKEMNPMITREQAVAHIQDSRGKFLSVEFTKRSDGSLRQMVCRTGVYSHLRGGTPSYDAASKGLLTVFSVHDNNYRAVPIEGLLRIKINGKWEGIQ